MSDKSAIQTEHAIIVFDGICHLCSGWVQFLIKRDLHGYFRFVAMQTETGQNILRAHGLDPADPVSFLLLEQGSAYTDSTAILRILLRLSRPWRILGKLLTCLPKPCLNHTYRWLARHRYRLFGRRETCWLPSKAIPAKRFKLND